MVEPVETTRYNYSVTQKQFLAFDNFRKEFKSYCHSLNSKYKEILFPLQKASAAKDTPDYPLETAIVYNTALDEITLDSEIKLIVIGDNPGKDEQLFKNQKYLVGQAGKIATGFFMQNPELKTDFRKNAIILNKTPIHSAKTNHLRSIISSSKIARTLLEETQIHMAKITAKLQQDLNCEIWMVGYSELKEKGLFASYKEALKNEYNSTTENWNKVFVFQHFSMNRFSIDLKAFMQNHPAQSLQNSIRQLGTIHKNEFF